MFARIAKGMTARYWLYAVIAAFLLGVLGGGWLQRTIDRAGDADALEDTIEATDRQGARTATTNQTGQREGAKAQVQNEGQTHATQERIRVVYRTEYVGADCRQPDGVRRILDEAVGRANDSVRAGAGLAPAGVPDP